MSSMERHDSSAGVAMLASYGEDESDAEDATESKNAVDSISDEDDTPTPNPASSIQQTSRPQSRLADDENSRSDVEVAQKKKKNPKRLVSYGADDLDDDDEEDESSPDSDKGEHGTTYVEGKVMNSSLNVEQASSLSRSVLNKSFDEIELPPEPQAKCSKQLQDKITKLYERRIKEGLNLNDTIQKRVDFRNPSIYEKLIEFCGIDEKGTNYPPELYNPLIWGKESYYDALDKAQKADMEKREKERKERTKVEFVTATKKSGSKTEITSSSGRPDEKKRKTKWDAEPSQMQAGRIAETINRTLAAGANLTSIATGTKSTVIPGTGSITKKPTK